MFSFYRFFYLKSSNNFRDTKLLQSLYTSEELVQLCIIKGKIKGNTAEEACPKPGSMSLSLPAKLLISNSQSWQLTRIHFLLRVVLHAWRVEQDVFVLQPRAVSGPTGGVTWSRSVALTVMTGAPTGFTMFMEAE